ncbi:hypothetical protein [Prevotella fusca]|uniref:Uncharacterized protein n=1 Tax=Prevotella fusca JCM 17724 TaxID=1236517 RepID=A0ABX7XYS0_9BACT|nr:hypothetical protein [Prevotella fusca]QUB86222.1 hypothetical protein J5A51_02935 [Prevotella fusca JCM 17724]
MRFPNAYACFASRLELLFHRSVIQYRTYSAPSSFFMTADWLGNRVEHTGN